MFEKASKVIEGKVRGWEGLVGGGVERGWGGWEGLGGRRRGWGEGGGVEGEGGIGINF